MLHKYTPFTLFLIAIIVVQTAIITQQKSAPPPILQSNNHSFSPSSIRWKENIVPIENALERLASTRGVNFNWKKEYGGAQDVGVIAEEIGWVFPEIVGFENDGSGYAYGVDYQKMSSILIEAINELHTISHNQQDQIDKLLARIEELENR